MSADLPNFNRLRYPFLRGFELDFYKKRIDNNDKVKANSVRTLFGTFTFYTRNNSNLTSELKRIKSLEKDQIESLEKAKKHSESKSTFSRYFLAIALVFLVVGLRFGALINFYPFLLIAVVALVIFWFST